LYYLATSLPKNEAASTSGHSVKFPKSFEELHQLSDLLKDYWVGVFSL